MTETNSDIICILGMHRSGTSLLSRILNILGVYLGSDEVFTMEPARDNPKGYWEHHELTSISDAILKRYGGSWDAPPKWTSGWETSPELDDLRQRARKLIEEQFAETHQWGWKDPRSCVTLPFWKQLLPDMRYIVCLRNPADVARSLKRRDGLSPEESSNLWLTYVTSALKDSEGKPRLVVFYEDLMDDWLQELRRLAEFLGKPERAEQVEVQEAVQQFIEKGLQHHRASIVEATASPNITFRARALYLAQRISESFGRREGSGRHRLDHQIVKALDALSESSFKASGQANPLIRQLAELEDQFAENRNTLRGLQTRLGERDREVETISWRFAQSEQTLQMLSTQLGEKDGMVQTLSSRLAEKDGILQMLTTQLAEKDGIIQTLSAQLVEKDGIVQMLSKQLGEKDGMVQTLSARLAEKDGVIQILTTRLGEKDESVQMLSTQLTEKNGSIQMLSTQLTEKDGSVHLLSTQLADKEGSVQVLTTQLAEKDGVVQTLYAELEAQKREWRSESEHNTDKLAQLATHLLNTETQLKRITDTLGWRLLSHYGRIKYRFLLPVYRLFGALPPPAIRDETPE